MMIFYHPCTGTINFVVIILGHYNGIFKLGKSRPSSNRVLLVISDSTSLGGKV